MKVEYHPINIDEDIFELSKDKHLKKSFVKPRKKKKKRDYTNLYIFLFILLVGFISYQVYLKVDFKSLYSDYFKKEVVIEKAQNVKKIENVLELPNHITLNDKIEQKVKAVLETIPNDMYIKEFKIDKGVLELKGHIL